MKICTGFCRKGSNSKSGPPAQILKYENLRRAWRGRLEAETWPKIKVGALSALSERPSKELSPETLASQDFFFFIKNRISL